MSKRLIYEEDAIDAVAEGLNRTFVEYRDVAEKMLNKVPSAQPEQSSEIQDILEYLDTVLHPIISPDHWNVYSELHDMISMLPSAQPEQIARDIATIIENEQDMRVILKNADRTETHSCDCEHTETHDSRREWYMHGYRDAKRWIPVTERMPEEHEWIGTKKFGTTISNEVYVTFETPDGERFAKHISFQNGKLSSVDEQRMKVWYKGAKPIAWMPLPEPWRGEEHEL